MTSNEPSGRPDRSRGLRWLPALSTLCGAVVVFVYVVVTDDPPGTVAEIATAIGAGLAVAAAMAAAAAARAGLQESQNVTRSRERLRAAERDLESALRAAQGQMEERPQVGGEVREPQLPDATAGAARLTLPELWTVTHSRLDLYHDIATGQAQRSFRHAQAAMICGFALLIVFVTVALNASTTAGSVVAGGLGAVSAALAGFVSRTFVKSQETAAAHLRAYFDQPLEFSRYLAAERLVSDAGLTPEQRAEVLTALVQAMVTPPAAPVTGLVPGQQQPQQ